MHWQRYEVLLVLRLVSVLLCSICISSYAPANAFVAYGRSLIHRQNDHGGLSVHSSASSLLYEDPHVKTILFVECGFGSDAHGQNVTKAAVRACRNAIEFNQIPSIGQIVPGGRDAMKLDVLLAIPRAYQQGLVLDPVRSCFPYGQIRIQIQDGGMIARNGKILPEMGDANEDMIVVCAAITVGY